MITYGAYAGVEPLSQRWSRGLQNRHICANDAPGDLVELVLFNNTGDINVTEPLLNREKDPLYQRQVPERFTVHRSVRDGVQFFRHSVAFASFHCPPTFN